MQKNKDMLDVLKFILSIFVVSIHTGFLGELIYPICSLAVPVFFVLSGYFAFLNLDKIQDVKEKQARLRHSILRLIKLYSFWFVVLFPYILYLRNYFEKGVAYGLFRFVKELFLDSTFIGSWYLMASIIGIPIVYLLSKKINNIGILLLTFPIFLFATFASEGSEVIANVPILTTVYTQYTKYLGIPYYNFAIALFYFAIGKTIADREIQGRFKRKPVVYASSSAVLLAVIFLEFHLTKLYLGGYHGRLLSFAPFSAVLLCWLLCLSTAIPCAKTLRKLSTVVYCSHTVVIFGVRKAFEALELVDVQGIYCFVVTLSICLLLGGIVLRLEKRPALKILRYSH